MTQTVKIPVATAQAALVQFAAVPELAEHAAAVTRALNPPQVWVLTGERTEESSHYNPYDGYFGRDDEGSEFTFGDPATAQLFSDAAKASFDAAEFAAANSIQDPDVIAELTAASFKLAPSVDEVADDMAVGNTEIDFLESKAFLAQRAETFVEGM